MGRRVGLGSALLGVAIGLGPQGVSGQEPARVPVFVDYSGHSGCPDQSAFIEQLQLRSRKIEVTGTEAGSWRFVVFIEPEGSGSRGTLRIIDPASRASERVVSAATCGEIVSALALVAALTADPEAAEPEQQSTQPAAVSQTTQPAPPMQAEQPVPAVAAAAPPERPEVRPPRRHWWSAGYELGGTSAVAPGLTLTQRLFLEAGLDRAEWLSPAGRLSVATGSGTIRTPVTNAGVIETEVTWETGRLEGLLLALQPSDSFRLRPGVYFEAGSYRGELPQSPAITPRPGAAAQLWLAAGVAGHASLRVVGPLVVELSAGGFVSFFDNEYGIAGPDGVVVTVIHDVDLFGGFISTAIGLTTP